MQQNNQESFKPDNSGSPQVDSLIREHRMLDDKVSELAEKSYLTPDQLFELAQMKKEKLRLKDRITGLSPTDPA